MATTFNASVGDIGEALRIVAAVLESMDDTVVRGKLLDKAAKAVGDEHFDVWDAGLGTHAKSTVELRRRRLGYYGRNAPNERAKPSAPYYEWTAKLREAASTLPKMTRAGGEVGANQAYRLRKGPIPGPRPFSETVLSKATEARIWPVGRIEKRIERDVLEQWVTGDVIPAARRRFR